MTDKPPYQVPSMSEIEAIPWNGFSIVSTFSGCGGSCLGFRMAGFRTLWASEFISAAQEVYRLNHPGVILDTRDIRQVKPEEILAAIGKQAGEIDVLEGSPPCASFSTAGKREAGWGKVKPYSDTKQRVDDLFFEYARILKGLQPKVFVAENVSGLVKGKAKGYFKIILAELKACGYNVKVKLLDAQWLGVPQMRQRVIFMGVRNDLGLEPDFPTPLPYRYSVREAIPWITQIQYNQGIDRPVEWKESQTTPANTVGIDPSSGNGRARLVEARVIHDTSGQFSQGDVTDRPCPAITIGVNSMDSGHYQVVNPLPPSRQGQDAFNTTQVELEKPCATVTIGSPGNDLAVPITGHTEKRKFTIAELKRICAFPDDFQLVGTYAQQWERLGRAVPPVMMAAVARSVRGILERL